MIITKCADLNKRVGETVAVRGELKCLKLLSVLVVDGGLSDNPTVGHFRYRQDKWQGGGSDRGVIDRNGFRCVGQVNRFQFAISGADGGWTTEWH